MKVKPLFKPLGAESIAFYTGGRTNSISCLCLHQRGTDGRQRLRIKSQSTKLFASVCMSSRKALITCSLFSRDSFVAFPGIFANTQNYPTVLWYVLACPTSSWVPPVWTTTHPLQIANTIY